MREALDLAEQGRFNVSPNPMVGCVLVRNGHIIGRGWHKQAGQAHAEINAISDANDSIENATVYVTLEPCTHFGRTPPCVIALIEAKVKRVVIACLDNNPQVSGRSVKQLNDAGIETTVGVLEQQARWLNRGFFKRMQSQKPWVTAKVAASLDGKTALANGESKWITSQAARTDVQNLRAASDVIITGVGTVLADNPALSVRIPGKTKQPLKVIMDRQLRTSPKANLFQQGSVLIAHSEVASSENKYQKQPKAHCMIVDSSEQLLGYLGEQQFNYAMVEAGARLTGDFIKRGLVDELVVYLAPDMLGSDARSMLEMSGFKGLSERIQFEFQQVEKIGRDLRITLLPAESAFLEYRL